MFLKEQDAGKDGLLWVNCHLIILNCPTFQPSFSNILDGDSASRRENLERNQFALQLQSIQFFTSEFEKQRFLSQRSHFSLIQGQPQSSLTASQLHAALTASVAKEPALAFFSDKRCQLTWLTSSVHILSQHNIKPVHEKIIKYGYLHLLLTKDYNQAFCFSLTCSWLVFCFLLMLGFQVLLIYRMQVGEKWKGGKYGFDCTSRIRD